MWQTDDKRAHLGPGASYRGSVDSGGVGSVGGILSCGEEKIYLLVKVYEHMVYYHTSLGTRFFVCILPRLLQRYDAGLR
jgi:hypothetical protein